MSAENQRAGGFARAKSLTASRRREIAKKAAQKRWGTPTTKDDFSLLTKEEQEELIRLIGTIAGCRAIIHEMRQIQRQSQARLAELEAKRRKRMS